MSVDVVTRIAALLQRSYAGALLLELTKRQTANVVDSVARGTALVVRSTAQRLVRQTHAWQADAEARRAARLRGRRPAPSDTAQRARDERERLLLVQERADLVCQLEQTLLAVRCPMTGVHAFPGFEATTLAVQIMAELEAGGEAMLRTWADDVRNAARALAVSAQQRTVYTSLDELLAKAARDAEAERSATTPRRSALRTPGSGATASSLGDTRPPSSASPTRPVSARVRIDPDADSFVADDDGDDDDDDDDDAGLGIGADGAGADDELGVRAVLREMSASPAPRRDAHPNRASSAGSTRFEIAPALTPPIRGQSASSNVSAAALGAAPASAPPATVRIEPAPSMSRRDRQRFDHRIADLEALERRIALREETLNEVESRIGAALREQRKREEVRAAVLCVSAAGRANPTRRMQTVENMRATMIQARETQQEAMREKARAESDMRMAQLAAERHRDDLKDLEREIEDAKAKLTEVNDAIRVRHATVEKLTEAATNATRALQSATTNLSFQEQVWRELLVKQSARLAAMPSSAAASATAVSRPSTARSGVSFAADSRPSTARSAQPLPIAPSAGILAASSPAVASPRAQRLASLASARSVVSTDGQS